ncbi:hypothetical protein XENOCAPTIV_005186 [Xenoophorus captivus]|uniref:Protein Wnt n=1 Tax=Xenoophorus captivus TaxID=1517983 RepID=A0ABV0Q837_9TELE
MDGCEVMCCGRGYNTARVSRTTKCECKFHWCCAVHCQDCQQLVDEYTSVSLHGGPLSGAGPGSDSGRVIRGQMRVSWCQRLEGRMLSTFSMMKFRGANRVLRNCKNRENHEALYMECQSVLFSQLRFLCKQSCLNIIVWCL